MIERFVSRRSTLTASFNAVNDCRGIEIKDPRINVCLNVGSHTVRTLRIVTVYFRG